MKLAGHLLRDCSIWNGHWPSLGMPTPKWPLPVLALSWPAVRWHPGSGLHTVSSRNSRISCFTLSLGSLEALQAQCAHNGIPVLCPQHYISGFLWLCQWQIHSSATILKVLLFIPSYLITVIHLHNSCHQVCFSVCTRTCSPWTISTAFARLTNWH